MKKSVSDLVRQSVRVLTLPHALESAQSASRPDLILIRGPSGSGKSTSAKEFVQYGYRHVETDMYFYNYGRYVFRRSDIAQAHDWCFKSAKYFLSQGGKVVISNIFSKVSEMLPYLKLAENHIVVEMTSSFHDIHRVSDGAKEKIKDSWEPIHAGLR